MPTPPTTGAKPSPRIDQMIRSNRERIIREWEQRVRKEVAPAAHLSHPILIDTLPANLDQLEQVFNPETSQETLTDSNSVAWEHGDERARLTEYEIASVVLEYQILRQILIDTLTEERELSAEEARQVHTSMDLAIQEAVQAFLKTQARFREQYVAALAHDLRNPLNIASMAAEIILADPKDSKEIALLATKIIESHSQIDEMIQSLLDVSRVRAGHRPELILNQEDMRKIVADVILRFSSQYGDRFPFHGPSVKGHWDRRALRRALTNLLTNALKYGERDTPIAVTIDRAHERVQVSVHNFGDPIPLEDHELIFEFFHRSKSAIEKDKKGWGLGLALVRSVAESHGGSILVESSREDGTRFTLDLPLDARPFQNTPADEPPPKSST